MEQEENKLKTYKILPYEVNDPSNSYGFIEYLPYDYDFDEVDYFKEASQIINKLKKKQLNENSEGKTDSLLDNLLNEKSNDEKKQKTMLLLRMSLQKKLGAFFEKEKNKKLQEVLKKKSH